MTPELPEPPTIYKRFCRALMQVALEGTGRVHIDHPVVTKPMTIEGWQPRRSANDTKQPHAPNADPMKRAQQGILGAALGAAGMEPVTVHADAFTYWIDLYFDPDRRRVPAPDLLGRMTRTPSIFTFYHEAPDDDALIYGIGASLNLRANPKKTSKEGFGLADSWLICAEHKVEVRAGLGLKPKADWPAGFYFGAPAFAMAAVDTRELAATRETLLLRLLGTGDVLEKALADQAELPPDALERRATRAALLAAVPPEGAAQPIEARVKDPVLSACRKTYRKWAARELEACS